ncbi:MAG: glucosaminidase domain-containing protein [Spirochaetota bacterium]
MRLALVLLALCAALPAHAEIDRTTPGVPLDLPPPELDDLRLDSDEGVSYAAFERHVRSGYPAVDTIYLQTLYRHYAELCSIEGVSLIVALAQMIHETGYLRFSGSVGAVQYNYAGLGAVAEGVAGLRFPNMRTGVAAHVQHIKAYADTMPLSTPLADPRFEYVRRGSAPTVRSLTGRWATDPLYGAKLMAHIERLRRFEANAAVPDGRAGGMRR